MSAQDICILDTILHFERSKFVIGVQIVSFDFAKVKAIEKKL